MLSYNVFRWLVVIVYAFPSNADTHLYAKMHSPGARFRTYDKIVVLC